MKNRNKLIMGSAIGLATIAVAIDHTKHRLPEPVPYEQAETMDESEDESPCGLDGGSSPCSMDGDDDDSSSPCGLGD